jgi:hypothetical protein
MNTTSLPPAPKSPYAHRRFFDAWWGKILGGLATLAGSYALHRIFADLETGAMESVRINWIVALLYNTLGHVPTVMILVLAGLGCLAFGVWQVIREGLRR